MSKIEQIKKKIIDYQGRGKGKKCPCLVRDSGGTKPRRLLSISRHRYTSSGIRTSAVKGTREWLRRLSTVAERSDALQAVSKISKQSFSSTFCLSSQWGIDPTLTSTEVIFFFFYRSFYICYGNFSDSGKNIILIFFKLLFGNC